MEYKIIWIGEVGLGVEAPDGSQIGYSLEEGQRVPAEFKVDDSVIIAVHPDPLASVRLENAGYYELTHFLSGTTLRVLHKNDLWRLES